MYEIDRSGDSIVVRKGQLVKLNAPKDSYLIYKDGDVKKISKIGDLTDPQLLLALSNIVDIPTQTIS